MNKVSFIQIPNEIVRDGHLHSVEFAMLVKFKYTSFKQRTNELEIDAGKLKCSLEINDNRTLKKYLDGLYTKGYMHEPVILERRKPMIIKLNMGKLESKPFTQLPVNIMSKIDKIGCYGLRLIYYYESYINRNSIKNQFCYAAYETIKNDTGISKGSITSYNEILVKSKLLKIEKHETQINDDLSFDKYNNHYYVRLENII